MNKIIAAMSLGILLMGISVFYYVVIFLPRQEGIKLELQKQELQAQQQKEQINIEQKRQEQATQRQQRITANKELNDCLNAADDSAIHQFYSYCIQDAAIGGSPERCPTNDVASVLEYMTASLPNHPYFKNTLDEREKDRGECFKLYSQN